MEVSMTAAMSNTHRVTVHDKYIVIDGLHTETGSFNYTTAAASTARTCLWCGTTRRWPASTSSTGKAVGSRASNINPVTDAGANMNEEQEIAEATAKRELYDAFWKDSSAGSSHSVNIGVRAAM
jgi:hypothetical protein